MAGISIADRLLLHPVIPLLITLVLVAMLQLIATQIWPSIFSYSLKPLVASSLLLTAAIAAGAFSISLTHIHPSNHIAHIAIEDEGLVLGETVGRPILRSGRWQFLIQSHRVYKSDSISSATGRVQVFMDTSMTPPLPGYMLLFRGKITHPEGASNPGMFDYRAYQVRRNIHALMYASHLSHQQPARGLQASLRRMTARLQQHIQTQINRFIPTHSSNTVLTALLLGDQSSITSTTQSAFRATGLTHILAVSGLHVMLVGFLIYHLILPFCIRAGFSWMLCEWTRATVTVGILLIYMLIAGARPSVVRAVVMAVFMIAGVLLQRPRSSINVLGAAALVLLSFRPTSLFDVGFQLSFSAVLSIVCLYPTFMNLLPSRLLKRTLAKSFIASCMVSISATLGTMPVLLFHFGYVSFAGIFLNVLALPLTTASLSAGLAMLAFSSWIPSLSQLLGTAADVLIQGLIMVAESGAILLPFLSFAPGSISWAQVLLLTSFPLTLLLWQLKKYRWRWLLAVLCVGFFPIMLNAFSSIQKIEIIYFDVGHGDAALVRFPNGRHMLIDTGNASSYANQTKRVVLPFLASRGIKRLDVVVISHPHRDHAGGLPVLVEAVEIGRIICATSQSPAIQDFFRNVNRHSSSKLISEPPLIQEVTAGDTLQLDLSSRIRILSPPRSLAKHPNLNETSVVLRVSFGRTHFLFLGDAESEAEQALVHNFPTFLYSDIVKIGHHGSNTSSRKRLVSATVAQQNATIGLVSVKAGTGYNLPDPEALGRWRDAGAFLHRTDDAGALWISSDGLQITNKPY